MILTDGSSGVSQYELSIFNGILNLEWALKNILLCFEICERPYFREIFICFLLLLFFVNTVCRFLLVIFKTAAVYFMTPKLKVTVSTINVFVWTLLLCFVQVVLFSGTSVVICSIIWELLHCSLYLFSNFKYSIYMR